MSSARLGTVCAVAKSSSSSSPKRKRRIKLVAAVLVLLSAVGYGVYHFLPIFGPSSGCTVRAGNREVTLQLPQAANAATIAAVATSRGLPERALAIALATSMQESGLRNLGHGDRDSLGLFQQRSSQGWGTAAQIMDPVYASNQFFDGLVKVKGYMQLPLTVAAQRVQKSGFPEAYAKHEADAALLASALGGSQSDALSCTAGASAAPVTGGSTVAVQKRLTREFGSQVVARAAAQIRTVAVPTTARAGSGTASVKQRQRGWVVAQWAVAHAQDLKVAMVAFGDHQWSAADSGGGWRKSDTRTVGNAAEDVSITVAQ
jgi:hypothetical protein